VVVWGAKIYLTHSLTCSLLVVKMTIKLLRTLIQILYLIIEVTYYDLTRYVLFKCDWADIQLNKRYKKYEYGFDLVNLPNTHGCANHR
jgi:type III secretory pathway component EscU